MKKKLLAGFATGLLTLGMVGSASATLVVTIERLSDTSARMTGTGTISGLSSSNSHLLYFDDLFTSTLTGYVNEGVFSSSNLTIGSSLIDFSYTVSTGFNWPSVSSGIYSGTSNGGNFTNGDLMSSGYVDWSLAGVSTSPAFAAGGATGDIYWGTDTANNITGSWTMIDNTPPTPTPEPATMLLFGTGLVGLVGSRLRRKKK